MAWYEEGVGNRAGAFLVLEYITMRNLFLALTSLALMFAGLAMIATSSLPTGKGAIIDPADRAALDALFQAARRD